MSPQNNLVIRTVRSLAAFMLNTLAAIIGTAVLESSAYSIWRQLAAALHLKSVAVLVSSEWVFSIVFAGLIGFFVRRRWQTATAKWVWLLPLVWFLFRAVPFVFADIVRFRTPLLGSTSQEAIAPAAHAWMVAVIS